ncbi:MAG: TrmH family RNA methyltransferase [Gammaproteobacteria bacterium]|nr:TrmH family RNA methyltransferase [Gammaproteobacteria bacterium]
MENKQLEHTQFQREPCKYPLRILADNFDLPTNVGSIFRIADALGIEKIYLTGTSPLPPNNKLRKASRATEKSVSYSYHRDPLDVINPLRQQGYRIISLEITSTSTALREFQFNGLGKLCLILGAERAGVSQALLDASDHTVHIPMLGQNSSLNVAMACAIAVYELTQKYFGRHPSETPLLGENNDRLFTISEPPFS